MPQDARAVALVLAAGRSSRMGTPKALLPCRPSAETFVARAVRVLREGGVEDVLVVGRPDDQGLHVELQRIRPAPPLIANPQADRGQLSSLVAGLEAAVRLGAAALVVLPVDLPRVQAASVRALLEAWDGRPAAIARVTHGGRHGHPVLFARTVFEELRRADPARGARAVLHADPGRVLNVEVNDPGVLRDVDVPADYIALFGPPG